MHTSSITTSTIAEPPRSPRWESVRAAFLGAHPRCVACGDTTAPDPAALNVHHVVPFHLVVRAGRLDLELDARNLLTLCEGSTEHHLMLGHLGDWSSYNPHVRVDVARPECRGRTRAQIATLDWWIAERASRPRGPEMTAAGSLRALRAQLDRDYPLTAPSTQEKGSRR